MNPYRFLPSTDGRYAYPSTGDVIDVKTRHIIGRLKDEQGKAVQSEKMLGIDWEQGGPVRTGDQFGLGRARNQALISRPPPQQPGA